MITILKPIFEVFTGEVAVCDNVIYNYLILLIVGEISFRSAWNFVGDLYHSGIISGSAIGSFLHWTSRLIIYMAIAYIIIFFIWLAEFIVTIPIWVWISCFATITIGVTAIYLIRKKGGNPNESTN